MKTSPDDLIGLYERHAREFDRDRSRLLQEKAWLDGFLACVRPSGTVLDLGCGMGEPIARYIIDAGFRVVGVDSSPSLIDLGRRRFPDSEWLVADMRDLALGRRFDGILAWDSFFHLRVEEQRAMFERYGPPRSESSAVTLRFSRQLAVLIGVATPLLETIRHGPSCTRFRSGGRPSWMTSSSARFSCTACGAPRDVPSGWPVLAAAWAFMCGMAYSSFFLQLAKLAEPDPSGLPPALVVAVKGFGLILGILGLAGAFRGRNAV